MNGKPMLYIDQWGARITACTLRELREKCGGGRIFKIYVDGKMGETIHIGYGVGNRWFRGYVPFARALSVLHDIYKR